MGRTLFLAIYLLVLGLSGCSWELFEKKGEEEMSAPLERVETVHQMASDVPIPGQAQINKDATLILGRPESWIGRLSYQVSTKEHDMVNYIKNEMVKFNWQLISVVQSKVSHLIFQKGNRIANVQIKSQFIAGAHVIIDVSPSSTDLHSSPRGASYKGPSDIMQETL